MLPTAYPGGDRHLSRPVYAVLALLCACMGLWASIITLRYFKHGALILEADDASRVLALAAATMFVFAEMGAFSLFSLLPSQRMYALRWKLITFVCAVLALEVVTVVAVQMAMTKNADMTQQTGAQRAQDLRRQIAKAEEEATALRAQSGQLANAEHAWVKAGAPKLAAMAASASAKTDGLYAELAKVDSTQRPTLIGLFGEDWAMAYAIARGILVSCAGLVFWGAVGSLWRGFMAGGQHQAHPQHPQYAPVAQPMAMEQPVMIPTPQPQPVPVPMAQPQPQPAPVPMAVPKPVNALVPSWSTSASNDAWPVNVKPWLLSAAAVPLALGAVAGVPSTAEAASMVSAVAVQDRTTKKTEIRKEADMQMDTGTGEKDGYRYRRVRASVKSGKLKPSLVAIQKAEGCGQAIAAKYLEAMAADGLVERKPTGRGWQLKPV